MRRRTPHRPKPWEPQLRCGWCSASGVKLVEIPMNDREVCEDRAACDLGRVRYLRRLDRQARGVSTARVPVRRVR